MTVLQCIRCVDPFCAFGIWPYAMIRFLQLSITITIYFQYSTTTYVVMDTLYACALKRTPTWLAFVVSILPVSEFFVGFAMFAAEYAVGQQWVAAVIAFYVVLMFTANLLTYNISGIMLIRILRKHQSGAATPSGEDITGSKSASPFDVVIRKTTRSLLLLSLPSMAALVMFFVIGLQSCNTNPAVPYNPSAPSPFGMITLFLQLLLGFLFTRVTWISKTALDAEVVGKAITGASTQSSEERRSTRTTSPEKNHRTIRTSQSPPRSSATRSETRMEVELQSPTESCASVAVTVDAVCENANSPTE
jgi:hypothetical protein